MDVECTRMGCQQKAVVLLAFDPRTATAWLRDLVDGHPSLGLSLCERHASRTTVPMGWTKVDERRPAAFDSTDPFDQPFGQHQDSHTEDPYTEVKDGRGTAADIVPGTARTPEPGRIVASPELPFEEPSPKWRQELDEWRDELARQREENERAAEATAAASSAVADLHEDRDDADEPAAPTSRPLSAARNEPRVTAEREDTTGSRDSGPADAASTADTAGTANAADSDGTADAADTTDASGVAEASESHDSYDTHETAAAHGAGEASNKIETGNSSVYRPGEINDDLSFEDIFPSLAPVPDEPTPEPIAEADSTPAADAPGDTDRAPRTDNSATATLPVKSLRPSVDPVDRDQRSAARDTPVASARPSVERSGPPVRRPSYLPTRSGSSTTFSVDASSPLLGRAFGFRPRP